MKVLLIGKNGQLARAIIQENEKFKFKLVAFSKDEINILDDESIRNVFEDIKPNVVINTSGIHANKANEENPLNMFFVNTIGVGKLAKFSNIYKSIFITISTNYVFDGRKSVPYVENDVVNPLQNYGTSKLGGEYLALNQNPDKSFVIRTSGIFGGKGSLEKGNFILRILKESRNKSELEVSNEQYMNLTYANDLAKAILKITQENIKPGILHLVNEGYENFASYAKYITKIVGSDCKIIGVNKKGVSDDIRRPLFTALQNTVASRYGIKMPYYQESIRKYLSN